MPSSIANVDADAVGEALVGIGVTDVSDCEGLEAAGASCITEITANVASPTTAITASSPAILVAFLARAGAVTGFMGVMVSTHPLRSYYGDAVSRHLSRPVIRIVQEVAAIGFTPVSPTRTHSAANRRDAQQFCGLARMSPQNES
jgi:hypothetical protein